MKIIDSGFDKTEISKSVRNVLSEGICLNSTANPIIEKNQPSEQLGNKTECALLELAHELDYNYKILRKKIQIVRNIPFSSSRKKMSTVVATSDPSKFILYTKGAPEFLLSSCSFYLENNSKVINLDAEKASEITKKVILPFAEESLRTLGLAYREISKTELDNSKDDDLETNMILISIAGIKDPLRPEVKEAIRKCHRAGITVRMVTGDNVVTAIAIAKECGILPCIFFILIMLIHPFKKSTYNLIKTLR